jgi:hypothetical protein
MLGLVGLFGYLAYASRHVSFEVTSAGLRIAGDIYGRAIPIESLDLSLARVTDLNQDSEHRLKWRTNGAGLPGYASGWFKLQNGEKALVFVTDRRRVLYVPTAEGYSVLMSAADPDGLLQTLHKARLERTPDPT